MAKWHVKEEFIELFTNKPPMRAGWCLVDDAGNYYEKSPGAKWITLDSSAAHEMADELNAESESPSDE